MKVKMSNNNDYLFMLDRINFPEKIPLDRSGYTYTCGRTRENDIVCHSTEVSKHHCTFFHNKNELYVTDLKSAHGIYVNGVLQFPFQTIQLHLNDVIGIGCSTSADLIINNDFYVYKIRVFQSLHRKDGESISAPLTTNSSNNKKIANYRILKQKRSNYGFKLLSKIPKIRHQKFVSRNNNFSEKSNKGKDKEESKTGDKLNAEQRIDMNVPTCSKNWPDNSARFPKPKESEEHSEQHLHAREQKNCQVCARKEAYSIPLNATLLNILSTEGLKTFENSIKMGLEKERIATSSANYREENHIFPKPKMNITTKSGNDIHLEQTIAESGRKIATEEPAVSTSRFPAADNTCSNAKETDQVQSKNVSKEMAMNTYYEFCNRLLLLQYLNNL